jgi:cell division protein FtsQ
MNTFNLKWLLILTFIIGITGLAWKQLKAQGANLLPINYVRIEGIYEYITKNEIKNVLLKHVLTGFLTVDMQAIRLELFNLPWITQVDVKRIWPDILEIKIYEQYPVVRWGKIGLLNNQGDLFIPDNLANFNQLPLLIGPNGLEKDLIKVMKRLQAKLLKFSLTLKEFKVNDRHAWILRLSNGLELKLGQKQPFQKFNRFLTTWTILKKKRSKTLAKVDLRYANGYAVTWK